MSPDAPPDDPHHDADPLYGEDDREERSGLLPEFVRKMAVAGLGALFMTEEGLRGLAGQLILSSDMARRTRLRRHGGTSYSTVFTHFLPLLRERGVTSAQIDTMLRDNPARLLGL